MSRPKQILVVDDEEQNLRLLKAFLEALGHEAETAGSGFDARRKLNSGFDLVLLDIVMPGIDGLEVVRRIRDDPEVYDIPIIMVTVLGDRETRLAAVEAGANDFIVKPIDKLELRIRVESLLKMKEAQDEIKRHRAELEETVEKRTAALLESEKRFRTLVETASDAIFIKDNELRYTDVNTVMVSFLDMQLSDIIGKTDKDVFGNDIAVQTRDVESRVLEGQTIETQESLIYKSQPISVDCIRFPLRGSSNEIMGVCGIVREMVYRPQMTSDALSPGDDYLSPAMRSTLSRALIAAKTNSIILLTGESGSGKDHLARYIHEHSSRCHGPLYAVNCAAIPSELAESELFGHEAGAFTGAVRRKRGLMELAEGGTLLLNEIGELSNVLQGKLLTFLDTFSFTRVGGEKKVTVNIRLLAATSKDLRSEVSEARFRKDLYYRLDVFPIHVPTLRERNEDIPVLVKEILSRLSASMVLRETPSVSFDALRLLCLYSWPGNVRELINVLERSLILCRGETIGVQHLVGMGETEKADSLVDPSKPLNRSLHDILGETERTLIEEALRRSGGNKAEAARCLGISPFALARHMTKLEIIWR